MSMQIILLQTAFWTRLVKAGFAKKNLISRMDQYPLFAIQLHLQKKKWCQAYIFVQLFANGLSSFTEERGGVSKAH